MSDVYRSTCLSLAPYNYSQIAIVLDNIKEWISQMGRGIFFG